VKSPCCVLSERVFLREKGIIRGWGIESDLGGDIKGPSQMGIFNRFNKTKVQFLRVGRGVRLGVPQPSVFLGVEESARWKG